MKFSRRRALEGATVAVGATLLGCGTDASPGDAGAMMFPDAAPGSDAGPAGRDAGPAPTGPFRHGVASGDPLPDAVILWTRVSDQTGTVEVAWELASEPTFGAIARMGTASTSAARDYTVKVDATGLSAGTTYYYRFRVGGETSPVGRTRTAPMGASARLRFAVCSCSSYAHGYFHGYRRISERADLDAVIHLGDYIYEYGTREYGSLREYEPAHEIVSLDDYRARYAQYRSDPDLAEAHRQHPFICVWDDHETADNAWREGAENHQPGEEGAYADRRAAAAQAYSEWLPIRDTLDADGHIFRSLRYGELLELVMLDTRIFGRDQQLESSTDPLLGAETRQLLGEAQEAWLRERLSGSTAAWKVIGQQVMMGQFPQFVNTDAWDGYPAQRRRIFEHIEENDIRDVIVLTGDIHTSWAIDLAIDPFDATAYDPETGEGAVAVELVCPGISSPGFPALVADTFYPRIEAESPHVKYVDLVQRGYFVLDVTPERAQVGFYHLRDVTAPYDGTETQVATLEVSRGVSHLSEIGALDPLPASPPALAP